MFVSKKCLTKELKFEKSKSLLYNGNSILTHLGNKKAKEERRDACGILGGPTALLKGLRHWPIAQVF